MWNCQIMHNFCYGNMASESMYVYEVIAVYGIFRIVYLLKTRAVVVLLPNIQTMLFRLILFLLWILNNKMSND